MRESSQKSKKPVEDIRLRAGAVRERIRKRVGHVDVIALLDQTPESRSRLAERGDVPEEHGS